MKPMNYYLHFPLKYYAEKHKKASFWAGPAKRFLAGFSVIFLLVNACFAASIQPAATEPQSPGQNVTELIAKLGSEDASERQSASAQLHAIGLDARPQILQASHSDDPQIREEAAQILLDLPWYVPDDSESVHQLLLRYGSPEVATRRQVVNALASLNTAAAFNALGRLFNEDPSNDVRWTILSCFREFDDGWRLVQFRNIEPSNDDPPLLAACGYSQLEIHPEKALTYLQRCAELETAHPSDDDGEFENVANILCNQYISAKEFPKAADLRRKQYARGSAADESGVPSALLELFALHADYGPLPGMDGDIQLAGSAMNSPKIQYAMSRFYARTGKKVEAENTRTTAFSASTTRTQRYAVGDFLFQHNWDELARPEFAELLKMSADPNDGGVEIQANAYFRLAGIAIISGDEQAAAQNKESAMHLLGRAENLVRADNHGRETAVSDADVWAEIHWHYLRAAQAKHDDAQIKKQLDELQKLNPTDAQIVIDIYPLLKEQGQPAAAQAAFDAAYAPFQAKLADDPHNPYFLNGIAWLCVECDQKLPEAQTWAEEAVAALPNDSAMIDTLAEINFHRGRFGEAVRLETHALGLMPGDEFMTAQLKRFRTAATRPTSKSN